MASSPQTSVRGHSPLCTYNLAIVIPGVPVDGAAVISGWYDHLHPGGSPLHERVRVSWDMLIRRELPMLEDASGTDGQRVEWGKVNRLPRRRAAARRAGGHIRNMTRRGRGHDGQGGEIRSVGICMAGKTSSRDKGVLRGHGQAPARCWIFPAMAPPRPWPRLASKMQDAEERRVRVRAGVGGTPVSLLPCCIKADRGLL